MTEEQNVETNWLDNYELEEDQRETLSKYKSEADAIKGAAEAQKMLGRSIRMPKDDMPDEERQAWLAETRAKLGLAAPESADEYELDLPDDAQVDETFVAEMRNAAHEAGIAKEQFPALAKAYQGYVDKMLTAREQETQQALESLKQEFPDFENKLTLAQRWMMNAGGNDLATELEKTGMGNNPNLIRFLFANAEKFEAEGSTISSGGQTAPDAGFLSDQFYENPQ